MNATTACAGVLMLATVLIVALPVAQAGEPNIKVEKIKYEVDGKPFEGVLAYDASLGKDRPGVLICHEWWGNNAYAASRARQLAELGYVAFALDVYGAGNVTDDPEQAGKWAGALYNDMDAMRRRAKAGLKELTSQPMVAPDKIAVIGYCFGGTVALTLARTGADVDAVVCFHTSSLAAKDPATNENIKGRVLVCTGDADPLTKPEELSKFKQQMESANVKYEIKHYPNAKHSFTNPGSDKHGMEAVGYNAAADKASWQDMLKLFSETIGAPRKGIHHEGS